MKIYAPYGSKNFNEYISEVLVEISQRFDAVFSRDELKALILGGGYGRGEGGVLLAEDGTEKLYNDLDLFVICKNLPPWRATQIDLQLKNLHFELTDTYHVDVDFSSLTPIQQLAKMPISLMWYELLHGHEVIWGNKHILQNLPRWEANMLTVSEAVKLLLNRGMGLYFARNYLKQNKGMEKLDFINRNIHKAYQGMAEAILIAEGSFHWSNLERLQLIDTVNIAKYSPNPDLPAMLKESIQFKLQPYLPPVDLDLLQKRLRHAIRDFEKVYYAVWAEYFGIERLDQRSYQLLLFGHKDRKDTVLSMAKNLALNLRDLGLNASGFNDYIKYPRYRLFYTFPWLLFGAQMPPESIAQMLGLPGESDPNTLEMRYVSLWERYN